MEQEARDISEAPEVFLLVHHFCLSRHATTVVCAITTYYHCHHYHHATTVVCAITTYYQLQLLKFNYAVEAFLKYFFEIYFYHLAP